MSSSTDPTVAEGYVEAQKEVIEEAAKPVIDRVITPLAQAVTRPVAQAVTKKPDELSLFWRPQEVVYIVVGPEGHKFGMHKDQLCASSAYFKAALQGGFQETVRGEVVLKDTNPTTFGMLNEWVYTGKITEKLYKGGGPMALQKIYGDNPPFRQLLDLWVLADYLLMPVLQNFVTDIMESRHLKRSLTPVDDFNYFYQKTQKGSPMRRFLVDLCIWRYRGGEGEEYRKNIAYMPREMAADLMIALARRSEGLEKGAPFVGKKYHVPVKA